MTRPLTAALFITPGTNAKAGAGLATLAGKFRLRLLIPTMAFAAIAWNSHAEVPVRTVAALEPIVPAIQQPKPDFEAGGFRVDMPARKIYDQAMANGYTTTLWFHGKSAAGVDGKSLATDDYVTRLDFLKESEDKSKKAIVVVRLLPGQGGVNSISQRVEFRYQPGQTHRTRQAVEADLIAKYGKPLIRVDKRPMSGAKSSDAHAMGLYCFGTEGTAVTGLDDCDVEKVHKNGYSYDIEFDQHGDVVSYEVEYDAGAYEKSYWDALFAKMHATIRDEQKPWWRMWL